MAEWKIRFLNRRAQRSRSEEKGKQAGCRQNLSGDPGVTALF